MVISEISNNAVITEDIDTNKTQYEFKDFERIYDMKLNVLFNRYMGEQLRVPIPVCFNDNDNEPSSNPQAIRDLVGRMTAVERFEHSVKLYNTWNQYSSSMDGANQEIGNPTTHPHSDILTSLVKTVPYRYLEIIIKYLIISLYEFKLMSNPFMKWLLETSKQSMELDSKSNITEKGNIHGNSWITYLIFYWGRDKRLLPYTISEVDQADRSKSSLKSDRLNIDLELLSMLYFSEIQQPLATLEELITYEVQQGKGEDKEIEVKSDTTDERNTSLYQMDHISLSEVSALHQPRQFFYSFRLALTHQGFESNEISQTLIRAYIEYIFTKAVRKPTAQEGQLQKNEVIMLLVDFCNKICGNTTQSLMNNTDDPLPNLYLPRSPPPGQHNLESRSIIGEFEDEASVYNNLPAMIVIEKFISIVNQNAWSLKKLWLLIFRYQELGLRIAENLVEETGGDNDDSGLINKIPLDSFKRVLIVYYLKNCYHWDFEGKTTLIGQLMRLEVNHNSVDFIFRLCRESFYQDSCHQTNNGIRSIIDDDIRYLIWEFVTRNLGAIRYDIDIHSRQRNQDDDDSQQQQHQHQQHHIISVGLICKFILALARTGIINVHKLSPSSSLIGHSRAADETERPDNDTGWKYLFEEFVEWIAFVEEAREVWQLARAFES